MTEEIGLPPPPPAPTSFKCSNIHMSGYWYWYIVFMFHCLNWDHHLATVVHLWKKKGMNGKVGHASNLKSWWGHIIAQFQNGTDIKISNLRNYFDEETLYFHSHWEKVHIIAQFQNATDKKTETEILVCIIFLFVFVLISIRICTYLELYLYLYLIRYLWIKVFPVSKGSFSPRLVAWLARLINFPQLCSPHRNIKLPYCKNIICKKYTNPAQQTYINIVEIREMWNEKLEIQW